MNEIFRHLPVELVSKILLFSPINPPHQQAYKKGIRIITTCELNCNLSPGNIVLYGGGAEENQLNEEWFLYLLTQEYGE